MGSDPPRRTPLGTQLCPPIDAQVTPEGVLIPLVYGPGADWCRNVIADGGCSLALNGQDIALTEPRVVSTREVESDLSADKARFWRTIGIEHCVSLTRIRTPAP
jgi:hypothetical protein